MPVYKHPGVYIEEIPSGSRQVEGDATSVAGFVGKATKGHFGEATLVQNLDDYNDVYGDVASESSAMGFAVQSFYLNGGKSTFICRLAGVGSSCAFGDVKGEGVSGTPTASTVVRISASSPGDWGNGVGFRIIKPDQDSLIFSLEIGHQEKSEFVIEEKFEGLNMRVGDDNYALTIVNENSEIVRLEHGDAANPDDAAEQYQDAVHTGGELDTANDYFSSESSGPVTLGININALCAKQITLVPADFTAELEGTSHLDDANSLASEIQKAVRALGTETAYQSFTCTCSTDHFVLTSAEPTVKKDKPLASVEVTEGAMAILLRLDKSQKALFKGTGSGPTGVSTYCQTNTADGDLVLKIDDNGDEAISLVAADPGLQGVDQDGWDAVALAIQNAVQAMKTGVAAYKDFKCTYASIPVASRRFTLTSGSGHARVSSILVTGGTLRSILVLDAGTLTAGRSFVQGTSRVVPLQMQGLPDQGVQLTGGSGSPATPKDFTDFREDGFSAGRIRSGCGCKRRPARVQGNGDESCNRFGRVQPHG